MTDIGQPPKEVKRSRSKKVAAETVGNQPGYVRPYRCIANGCTKAFTRAEHLKRHQLNHNSGKIWRCITCSVTFVRKDLWQRHLRVSHETNDLYPPELDSVADEPNEASIHADSNTCAQSTSIEGINWVSSNSASLVDQSPRDASFQSPTAQYVSARVSDDYDELPGGCLPVAHDSISLWSSTFEESWIQEMEEWRSDFCTHQSTRFADTDMQWFFDNQQPLDLEQESYPAQEPQPSEPSKAIPLRDTGAITAEIYNVNGELPPVYLQELQSKVFVAKTGQFDPPSCGFRVCNALTDERRIELLMDLRNLTDVDLRDPIFSLNSMKHGIHLFCRNVNIEYAFIHHELICPSSQDNRQVIIDVFGEEPGPQLMWIIITLGWTLMRSDNNHESHMASKIQRTIRTSIINVKSPPPLLYLLTSASAPWIDKYTSFMDSPNLVFGALICKIPGNSRRVWVCLHVSWRSDRSMLLETLIDRLADFHPRPRGELTIGGIE